MQNTAVMQLAANDSLTSATYGLQGTSTTIATTGYCYGCYTWPCRCHNHTYQYIQTPFYVADKTKAAFSIAKKLLKSKFIKADKIQEFVELVEMIEKEL